MNESPFRQGQRCAATQKRGVFSVELCDANHVVAVLDDFHHLDRTQLHPIIFIENLVQKIVEFANPNADQMASGPAECLRLMMPFFVERGPNLTRGLNLGGFNMK
jgi:hypothetical protein